MQLGIRCRHVFCGMASPLWHQDRRAQWIIRNLDSMDHVGMLSSDYNPLVASMVPETPKRLNNFERSLKVEIGCRSNPDSGHEGLLLNRLNVGTNFETKGPKLSGIPHQVYFSDQKSVSQRTFRKTFGRWSCCRDLNQALELT
jgi:hypothetical protein